LYGKDSGEFTFVDTEHFGERPPSSLKEDSIKRAVVLKEHSEAFGYSKDRMAMWDVFDDFAVDMLSKLHCSLGSTGGKYPSAFARERDEE
jgi:hypothetical protein